MPDISFGWTADLLPPKGCKRETRRDWKLRHLESWIRAWERSPEKRHAAYDKCAAYGGKQIGWVTTIDRPFVQELREMTPEDVAAEGHPEMLSHPDPVASFLQKYFWKPKKSWSDYQREDEWEELLLKEVSVYRFHFEPLPKREQLTLFSMPDENRHQSISFQVLRK